MRGKIWGSVYDLQILLFFGISGVTTTTTNVKQSLFKLPEINQVLICCDDASKGNPGIKGFGFIAREHSRDCIGAASGGMGVATNHIAEVMALIVAGEWVISMKFQKVCFSLDSKAVLIVFSNNKVTWIVLSRCEQIKKAIHFITLRHSYREINFSADTMAKKGVLMNRGVVIYYEEKPHFPRK